MRVTRLYIHTVCRGKAGRQCLCLSSGYDTLGRLIEEEGTQGQTSSYTYDADGNQTSQMDPLGRETIYGYDELDRLESIIDPQLQLTGFAYNALDQLESVTDPRTLTTSYDSNGLGDQDQLTSPDTGVTSYTHDAAGNVDTATDARDKTVDYDYDAAGRLVQASYPDRTVQYNYDQGLYGAGRLTRVSDGQSSLTWGYDATGRVTQRSQTVDTVTLDVDYGYDASGRLSTQTTPSGQVIGYSFGNGRVTGLTVNGTALLGQVSYRPFGPVTGWQWGNGTTMTRTYDTDGQLTAISSAGTTSYQYFLDGHIRSTTADVEFSPTLTEGSTLFAVDTASNRVQSSSGLETRSYSYDAAGNTLSDGSRTYSYNDTGRLATATHQGVTTSYVYSGLGERVKKSNGSVTRYFAYDEAGQLLGEYDAQGALIQETVWIGSLPVATLRPDGSGGIEIYYVHTDHLNTPRRVTQPVDDMVVWRWQSVPFGATAADEDPDGDQTAFTYNLRFPGQYSDEESGLYYNYFRTYDPSTGRYLESDPIGFQGGLNTYGYVGGNPLAFIDPLGLYRGTSSGPTAASRDMRADKEYRRAVAERLRNEIARSNNIAICFSFFCISRDLTNDDRWRLEGVAAPDIGFSYSRCYYRRIDEQGCPLSEEPEEETRGHAVDVGFGRYLGVSMSPNEECLNLGVGVGSPVNATTDLGPTREY